MQLIPLDFLPRKGAALKPPLISSQEGNCSQTFPPNTCYYGTLQVPIPQKSSFFFLFTILLQLPDLQLMPFYKKVE
jgi:hypothetical protein